MQLQTPTKNQMQRWMQMPAHTCNMYRQVHQCKFKDNTKINVNQQIGKNADTSKHNCDANAKHDVNRDHNLNVIVTSIRTRAWSECEHRCV